MSKTKTDPLQNTLGCRPLETFSEEELVNELAYRCPDGLAVVFIRPYKTDKDLKCDVVFRAERWTGDFETGVRWLLSAVRVVRSKIGKPRK